MTRFQDSIDRLASRLQEQDGRSVDYHQASHVVSGITGVPMDEEYTVSDGDGGYTKMQSNDWIFTVTDLDGLMPRPGDQVHETRGTEARIYEVMPVGKRPCCEDHDNSGVMVVVHTKRIQ